MDREINQEVVDIMQNPLIQKTVATGTTTLGIVSYLDMASNILGIIGLIVGIVASITIILKNMAETRILKKKEEVRLGEVKQRQEEGLDCRRKDDDTQPH